MEYADVIQFRRLAKKCEHSKFVVDERQNNVECADCGESLNPIWVLRQLSFMMQRFEMVRKEFNITKQKLEEKIRFKCGHCGEFTRLK